MTSLHQINDGTSDAASVSNNVHSLRGAVNPMSLTQMFAAAQLPTVSLSYEEDSMTVWADMNSPERPSFTPELLRDLAGAQRIITRLFDTFSQSMATPIRHLVVGSKVPNVYNLGGDLGLFIKHIEKQDRSGLTAYAISCIDVIHQNYVSMDRPINTVALVQGDALGGGFETALSCDVIIAEKKAKFGLPEVLFNLFPGMGAYSFLARRLDGYQAEKMIMSGKLYTAEELFEMGIVDVLAENGEGRAAATEYVNRNSKKYNAHSAIYRAGRIVQPVTYDELKEVVEVWVEAALQLTDSDMKKMLRLTKAQDKLRPAAQGEVAL
ncbi:enoyl-CoA hydratase [Rhodobacteraceae bacterium RKSG542]|nr:enoyl-CoA hydratase [Pseudovibrio flavus]